MYPDIKTKGAARVVPAAFHILPLDKTNIANKISIVKKCKNLKDFTLTGVYYSERGDEYG
jgi:hypothetical protein